MWKRYDAYSTLATADWPAGKPCDLWSPTRRAESPTKPVIFGGRIVRHHVTGQDADRLT
jgi:hypothetical protein